MQPWINVHLQLFAEERTEPATPRRREEARRKGQVARTTELGTAVLLLASFFVLSLFIPRMGRRLIQFSQTVWTVNISSAQSLAEAEVSHMFVQMITMAILFVGPLAGITLVVGLLTQVVQVGFMATGEPLKPQLQRLNPISGLKRLFSKRAVAELVKATIKITVIGIVMFVQLRKELPGFAHFSEMDPMNAIAWTGSLVYRTGLWVGIALLVLAAFDYAYQRWEHEQSIKMTKKEVRDEARQMEGDPQIRARMRQRQRQIATARMMAQIPMADVIITNPVHVAIALQYDADRMEAPTVLAKGAGPLAHRIKHIGTEHGITVVTRPELARALYETTAIGDRIPEHLYQAVAEVLAFVYRLRSARGRASGSG